MLDKQLKDQYNWKLELTNNRTIEKQKLTNRERKMNGRRKIRRKYTYSSMSKILNF